MWLWHFWSGLSVSPNHGMEVSLFSHYSSLQEAVELLSKIFPSRLHGPPVSLALYEVNAAPCLLWHQNHY